MTTLKEDITRHLRGGKDVNKELRGKTYRYIFDLGYKEFRIFDPITKIVTFI